MELYLKYRPKTFKDVVGQPDAVRTLVELGRRKEVPHCLLFTGPSGCGKTTLARIVKDKLGCSDIDFLEVNAADARGIEMIRDIRRQMSASPLGGSCRIWLIDEVHSLTGDAQNSFLKMLEDTPGHVYFLLATTDPQKLKKTIITRCTEIRCKPIDKKILLNLVSSICDREGKKVSESILKRISEVAEESARKALVILNAIIGIESETDQMAAIESADIKGQAIAIARALMNSKTKWSEIKEVIKTVDEDVESIRHMILGYARSVLLGNGDHGRAALIIEEFRDNWYDCKAAGLVVSCWNVISSR